MKAKKMWPEVMSVLMCLMAQAGVATPPPVNVLHLPGDGAAARLSTHEELGSSAALTVVEDGFVCTVVDFEGVGNLSAIPVFDGISSPGWLGIIDEDAGGSGNFAFEPSPETIAFWLGGAPGARDILFSSPVSKVGFSYASYVTVTLEAFDQGGALIGSVSGPPNFNQGPGGDPGGNFNQWDPLEVGAGENVITRVRVSGNVNQTGIDDLKVCTALRIASVEPTQTIQELQEIDDLVADLQADGEPPVAIIEGKPMALRVYMQQVQAVTTVEVELDIQGVPYGSQTLALQPQCTPGQYRAHDNGCQSIDFTLVPPAGSWTATLRLKDDNGDEIEAYDLPFVNRSIDELVLRAVSICDARIPEPLGTWQCSDANDLIGMADFLRLTAPTDSVSVEVTSHQVRRRTAAYDADGNGIVSDEEMKAWWVDTVRDVGDFFDFNDSIAKLLGQDIHYYGMVRPGVPGGVDGIADGGTPSHGAVSRASTIHLGVETNGEVVAHQIGRMFARRDTNVGEPAAAGAPGCYATAEDPSTDWPFADNRIRSVTRLEVGFDVSSLQPVDPQNTFDWMSFCTPRWISPFTYSRVMSPLQPAFKAATADPGASAFGPFWKVGGVLNGAGAGLGPIFTFETEAWTDPGTGSHRVEVRDTSGTALFTRFFTPDEPHATGVSGILVFNELLPVRDDASRIVVLDSADTELLSVDLGGTAPSVAIDSPAGGELLYGESLLEWSFDDPDSSDHWSWVEYSWDHGETWASLGVFRDETALTADLATLPGASDAALIRVRVSDGVNTGSAVSATFSVDFKTPAAEILSPDSGKVLRSGDLVWLRAGAYDVDDGVLDGVALVWESSLEGALGYGASLPVEGLSPGHHEITLTATDSDGNQATASTVILEAGSPPVLDLDVEALDQFPTTCVQVSIDAQAAPQSVGLRTVEYSLDGGASWVELDRWPADFLVPGAGFFHVAARVVDEAGQVDAADARFFVDSPCQNVDCETPPAITITGVLDGAILHTDAVPVIDVFDTHLATVTVTVNGQPFTRGTTITAEGDYTLVVNASDECGNSSTETVTFTIDKTPPDIEITGISDGETVTTVVTPTIEVTDAHLGEVTMTLNGESFTSGTTIDVIADYTLVVTAGDLGGNSASETLSFTVEACVLHPVALSEGTLQGVNVGDLLDDISAGTQPGNFGWLTWTGAVDVPTLVDSLTPPGDSDTFVNELDPDDHLISAGDWIQGMTGVANARPIRDALDVLETMDVLVPVWDQAEGQGSTVRYHTAGFAQVRLTEYRLSTPKTISATFLGTVVCADRP